MLVWVCLTFLTSEPQTSVTLAPLSKSTLFIFALGFGPLYMHIRAYTTGIAGFSESWRVKDTRCLLNIASNVLQFL